MLWTPPKQKQSSLYGILTKCLFFAVFVPALLIHRVAFAIDNVIFPQVNAIEIRKPLFIVGLPRSGTTTIHRMMSSHSEQFTTMPLWELIFAPALCQKYLIWGAYKVDAFVGSPVWALLGWIQDRLTASFDDIHPTRLTDPEEDYLGLCAFNGCFLRLLLFPYQKSTWALGDFSSLPAQERRRLLNAYQNLVKRHLAFRGTNLRFLSKNPCFTTWVSDLAVAYPDAAFIGTYRNLAQVIPSQLSAIDGGLKVFGHSAKDPWIIIQFSRLLSEYEKRIIAHQSDDDTTFIGVDFEALVNSPESVIEDIYRRLQILPRNEQDAARLEQLILDARAYRSKHKYSPKEFGLQENDLGRELGHLSSADGIEPL